MATIVTREKTPRKKSAAAAEEASARPRLSNRVRAAIVIAVAAASAWGLGQLWLRVAPSVVHRDRYLLPAENITLSPPPDWLVGDVRTEVIRNAGLDRRLSVADDNFIPTVRDAFALSPWIASVERVEKSYPPAVHLTVTYREPIAVVEFAAGAGVRLLPVDRTGVHLPMRDVAEIRLRYLPRLSGIVGQPPVGQRWDDPRVAGGLVLAERLAEVWEKFYLVEIVPSVRPEVRGGKSSFLYRLVTRGGTRINWGAPPGAELPGEPDFAAKLARLENAIVKIGPLNTVRGPDMVDVRYDLVVTPRAVQHVDDAVFVK
ncbi:MAG: hypothetical protein CMJ58_16300 [Planctomycetaceae bacterium]|nr:hypothetical protein [Planctomycetaceae bacterium]